MGYMYILKCRDNSYYTGSTVDLNRRLWQHNNGEGANFTKRRLPAELVYYEEYPRIDEAFYREKQVQGWTRKKKEALIEGRSNELPKLAKKIWRKHLTRSRKGQPAFDTPPPAAECRRFASIRAFSPTQQTAAYRSAAATQAPAGCLPRLPSAQVEVSEVETTGQGRE